MAQVKGKFIKLAGFVMFPDELKIADEYLKKLLGLTHDYLEDEEWYDTSIFDTFMKTCVEHSLSKERLYITIGKKVYPTIKNTTGLPEHLVTPLDFIKFEAEGFLQNHRGEDVFPRKIIKAEDHEVIMQAKAPGYSSKLYEGVWLGILYMCDIKTGHVENLGDDIFKITW
jgi:hypothetical protein